MTPIKIVIAYDSTKAYELNGKTSDNYVDLIVDYLGLPHCRNSLALKRQGVKCFFERDKKGRFSHCIGFVLLKGLTK